MSEAQPKPVDRRKFLQAAGGTLALSAASYAGVVGSNTRVNVGFIGCGGRAQAHLNLIVRLATENRGVTPMAVCDVWDGLEDDYQQTYAGNTTTRHYSQGLYPAAKKCGLNPADRTRVVKDYRKLLDLKDIDAVCISTPDHWHAKQTLDAFAAGKDVYVEKPMTRTAAEALAVQQAATQSKRVLCVGVQQLADPVYSLAQQAIAAGQIGAVSQLSAGVYRNDERGQWRFYRIAQQMNPRTIDWKLWLGSDDRTFAQWRCEKQFSGGPITDFLAGPLTRLLAVTGLRTPRSVLASGGLYVEQDGRSVPDVATVVAEFAPGAQLLLTAATTSAYPTEELIRGRTGTIKFVKGGYLRIADAPGCKLPPRLETEWPKGDFIHRRTTPKPCGCTFSIASARTTRAPCAMPTSAPPSVPSSGRPDSSWCRLSG
jgi:predicted dehydrogenase